MNSSCLLPVKQTNRQEDLLLCSTPISVTLVSDGGKYRLAITEQKTGKQRVFTVPLVIYQYIENFCLRNGIGRNELMFPLTTRAVQKQLALVCDYLGYEGRIT